MTTTVAVADALVLFGATGDLAKRKLFPALYHLERRGRLELPVIGVGRSRGITAICTTTRARPSRPRPRPPLNRSTKTH